MLSTESPVPDSEDEQPRISWSLASPRKSSAMQVIEISSDSDSEEDVKPISELDGNHDRCKPSPCVHNEVIELTDSDSSDASELPDMLSPLVKGSRRKGSTGSRTQGIPSKQFIPLYADECDDEDSDRHCILVLNDPPRARKPIRVAPRMKNSERTFPPVTSSQTSTTSSTPLDDDEENGNPSQRPRYSEKTTMPASEFAPRKSPSKRPAPSKKAREAGEQARREKYASELFAELNRTVFGDRLPRNTTLEWSKRLLTTAGRACWHRNREGVDHTKIELAIKILDCDERIRNTLSHEMCHLACWVIDNHPQEGHGQLFKSWASKVTRKRPDIHISTRHNYEISYPYEWKCNTCSKIYGRYSKSIRPDECVCGACKTGKLIPLFTERASSIPKISRMAIAQSQGSPIGTPSKKGAVACPSPTSGDEDDLSDLSNILRGISLRPS